MTGNLAVGAGFRSALFSLCVVLGILPLMAADCAADTQYGCSVYKPNPNRYTSRCTALAGTQHRIVVVWSDGAVVTGPWTTNVESLSPEITTYRMGLPHQASTDHYIP